MKIVNEMCMDFYACPENEAFARMTISAFILPLNPTLEEMGDVKTAISEAVTNAIVHGYKQLGGTIRMHATLTADNMLTVDVIDNGCGIEDIAKAREPFFTTETESERSGMGFTVMESFMDSVEVRSRPKYGTSVRMQKNFAAVNLPAAKHA